ncbi:MAG: hypothetical protein IPJ79_19385 [Bacteroidetes bacterium]|nr:hypothetical protein [Bacteroidota bacterium]
MPVGIFNAAEFNPVNDNELGLTISTAQTPEIFLPTASQTNNLPSGHLAK